MGKVKKKGFIMYCDLIEHIDPLTMEQRGVLFSAILCDQNGMELPEMDAAVKIAFSFSKKSIDMNTSKYEQMVEKRKEAGKKGGDAKASSGKEEQIVANASKSVANCSKTKQNEANDSKDIANASNDVAKGSDNREQITDNSKQITENREQETEIRNQETEINDLKDKVVPLRINYQEIVDLYNETCVSFPRLTVLSDDRKKAIKARLKTYTMDDFRTLFEKAEASSFLKGANDRNWSATFDWLISDKNMAKVLDGNYDNRDVTPTGRRKTRAEQEMDAWMQMLKETVEEEANGGNQKTREETSLPFM